MTSDITLTDGFCGCGGSSSGAVAAGITVKMAINHWDRAIETHQLNHPKTDHDLADLQIVSPKRYQRTTMLWMSPSCFVSDTMILSKRGIVPIQEIVVGDQVLTHMNRWMPVTSIMKSIQNTLLVRGQGHSGLEVTGNHPFYARRHKRVWNNDRRNYEPHIYADPEWIEAECLTSDRFRWSTPINIEPVGIPLILSHGQPLAANIKAGIALTDLRLWWVVGRWLGDGMVRIRKQGSGRSEVSICCGKHESDRLEAKLSSWKPEGKRIGFGELNWRRTEGRTGTLFSCGHDALAHWLIDNFGQYAYGKTIPAWALTMPVEFRTELLEGYLSADGHRTSRRTTAVTVSKRLAIGVRLLAESLGYRVGLTYSKPRGKGVIEGRSVNQRAQWGLHWETNRSQRAAFDDGEHAWSLVKEIKPCHTNVEVYNLAVAEDESYVADGIVVHNCVNHTTAKGRKRVNLEQLDLWGNDGVDPAEEKSRMTMAEVCEFTEQHRYEIVVIENVIEIHHWQHFDYWLHRMINLGYEHKALYLNAMFFGVPQSRDRVYIVFWKKGNKAPDLDFRPLAYCIDHGLVYAQQSWKRHVNTFGRYGKNRQYVYVCPDCGRNLEPFTPPASDVIDWALPSQRIGDRKKPLKDKTTKRILEGLRKFSEASVVDVAYDTKPGRTRSVQDPLSTLTKQQTLGLVEPFLLSYMNQATPGRSVDEPLYTIATQHTPPLITPPRFLISYYGRDDAQSLLDMPLPTLPTANKFALISTNYFDDRVIPIENPMATQTTSGKWGLLTVFRGSEQSYGTDKPLSTITQIPHHYLIEPFIVALKASWSPDGKYMLPSRSMQQPLLTLVHASQHYLVEPQTTPYPTHPILPPEAMIAQCGFRMLEPHELKLGMSFVESYIITGNKREQTKQIGDAVCVNVAQAILERCVASLS